MKKNKLLTLLSLLMPMLACAYDAKIKGIYYNFTGNEAEVTYKECHNYRTWNNEIDTFFISDYSGEIVIPENVTYKGKTYNVTSIGNHAFYRRRWSQSLTSVIIPQSVNSIGECAFMNCCGLTSITIPGSVKIIGGWAFQDCTGLSSVTICNGVTNIGCYAFSYCIKLTSITIPGSVMSIGEDAFWKCFRLTAVTISDGVVKIGTDAFAECSDLTSVFIPRSVKNIGYGVFARCNNLNSIKVEAGNTIYDSRYDCNAIIQTATNTLVIGCAATVIPNSVKSIDYGAFFRCSGLTSIIIPESVTSIGKCAFSKCDDLTSLYIQNSKDKVEIGEDAIPTYTHVGFEKKSPPFLSITKNSVQILSSVADNELFSNTKFSFIAHVCNDGDQVAQMCVTKISLNGMIDGIYIEDKVLNSIKPGETKEISIPFQTSSDTRNGEVTFTLQIIEKNGYNSETVSITVPIYAHGTNQISAEGLKHRRAADELVKIAKKPEDLFGAIEEYKLVLDTDPSYSDAYYNLAELYKKVGNEMDKKYYSDAKLYYIQFKRLVPEESADIDDKLYLLERLMKQ